MCATTRRRLIRTSLSLAIAAALLAPVTALGDDGTVTITSPKNHQTFKSATQMTVSGTVNVSGAVSVVIDPSWAHEFSVKLSGSSFSSNKLHAPKVKKKGTYSIDVNALDSNGQNIAEGTVIIKVTP
jgi:hypothetical protein